MSLMVFFSESLVSLTGGQSACRHVVICSYFSVYWIRVRGTSTSTSSYSIGLGLSLNLRKMAMAHGFLEYDYVY